jgi:hypothetical protein
LINLHWNIIITQSPLFISGFTVSTVCVVGLSKCAMSCIYDCTTSLLPHNPWKPLRILSFPYHYGSDMVCPLKDWSLAPSMAVLKGGRTFKKWSLVQCRSWVISPSEKINIVLTGIQVQKMLVMKEWPWPLNPSGFLSTIWPLLCVPCHCDAIHTRL